MEFHFPNGEQKYTLINKTRLQNTEIFHPGRVIVLFTLLPEPANTC